MNTYLLILLVLVAVVAAMFVYGRERVWTRFFGNPDLGPFNLRNPARNGRPNDGLVSTNGLCEARIDEILPEYDTSPEHIITGIHSAFEKSGLRYKRVDDGTDQRQARYVTWTEGMRFPDTTQFMAVPLEGGKTGLIGYARAQVGYSDAGNNLKRLKTIVKGIDA